MVSKHSISFCGKIIETTSVAEKWDLNIRSMCNAPLVVGLNCKWRPHPIRTRSGKIVALQLCVDAKARSLQLTHMDYIPLSVPNFLSDTSIVFVGIEVEDIMWKLKNEYGLYVNNKIDIRTLA
ncbi:Werner Syndrome-like exonuclease [Melia azedarach]|uniref:Werner Syndrome-like exonuclease n=1 Tax=Melia azedarach TaxID=155640 RepID=A0ACC1YXC6_MELAZ|nr:Werner Syndrome-like exonuclease [Melia azedarach]